MTGKGNGGNAFALHFNRTAFKFRIADLTVILGFSLGIVFPVVNDMGV